jgi:hypothetical protein
MPFLCGARPVPLEFLSARGLLCPASTGVFHAGFLVAPRRQEFSMLDFVFLGGGVLLFCLLIAYERLCNRL